MFASFSNGIELTKASFGVIRKDPEMLLFPVLGGFFSLLYSAALLVPTLITKLLNQSGEDVGLGIIEAVAVGATYFGLAFIATFFNTCVVYTSKVRFEGGDASFMDSIKFALSRIPQIAAWSAPAASVGLVLKMLDDAAERAGGIGGIIIGIIRGILGAAWSIMTIFVVPVMVYEGVGPFDAIKRSVQTLKQTWGENLVRYFGFGLIQFLAVLPGVAIIFLGVSMVGASPTLGLIVAGLGFFWIVMTALVFQVAVMVFNTALYSWANSGRVVEGFSQPQLQGAMGPKR